MADYISRARSNYFKVKAFEPFQKWCENLDGGCILEQGDEDPELVTMLLERIPLLTFNEDQEDWEEVDFPSELAKHLQEGSVAVLIEVGSEKFRYLVGFAVAVNSEGRSVSLDLNDIYEKAAELGKTITRAEY